MKNRINIFLFLTLLVVFSVILPHLVFGETSGVSLRTELSSGGLLNGRIDGVGNFFEVKNSDYLDVTLRSTEEISVLLESIPKMISLDIRADSDIGSTELSLGGLEPDKTYNKYEDSYKNRNVFISDSQGNYKWDQDLSVSHHIWFQEVSNIEVSGTILKNLAFSSVSSAASTAIFLPEQCSNYGTWDFGTSICTLNKNLNQGVEITDDNITLDCNNNKIIGGSSYGVNLFGRKNITIKNCEISGQSAGVNINSSGKIFLGNNNIIGAWDGVDSMYSAETTLINNKITSSRSSASVDFYHTDNNVLDGNDLSGEVYFYYTKNNTISRNNITGSSFVGIYFYQSANNNATKNNIFDNRFSGVIFDNSTNNTFSDNTVSNNLFDGIDIMQCDSSTFTNNVVSGSGDDGIYIDTSSNDIFSGNSISNNDIGIDFCGPNKVKIYHNNFINNQQQARVYNSTVNFFDNGYYDGGNYWSDYAGVDLNSDGIGDVPYVFEGGQDNYPFMEQDGWLKPTITPVLVVPGLMGTELKNGNELLWPDLLRMLGDIGDNFMNSLGFNFILTPVDDGVNIGKVVENPDKLFNYTEGLINEFKNQGYVEGQTLFTFPYDWRYGVTGKYADGKTNSDLLAQKIQDIMAQTGASKVDVVAHSMGGLIVKEYAMNHPTDNHIGKAVFVGVPNTGAPKALKVLLQGDNFGIPWLADSEMKKLAENMPASYDLLPSQQYYDTKGSFVEVVDRGGPFNLFPTQKNLNYYETQSFLTADHGLNELADSNAQTLHTQSFDNFDLRTAGVDVYAIDGCKAGTLGKVVEERYTDILGGLNIAYKQPKITPGDGTVPLESATNLPVDQSKKYYSLTGDHSKMPSQAGVRQEIVNLISGSNLSVGGNLITQDISKCNLNGKAISVFSPVDVFVTDQNGNKLGLAEDGSVINEIPNADFEIWGEHKFLYLPQDGGEIYNINLQGTDTGTYTIKSQNIANSQIGDMEVFSNLAVTPALTGQIIINPSDNTTTLSVKQNVNDVPTTILPSGTLDAAMAEDLLPPISVATLTGNVGQPGFYRSDVSVNIKVTDNLSGVLNVEYNLDNAGYQKIFGEAVSIIISGEGKHTLTFFSTDTAGNNEQEQIATFTIDKIAPEVVIQFDPVIKDLKFTGVDNISNSSLVLVEDKDDVVILTDQAGNTTEIRLKDKNRKKLMSAEVKSIKYNGVAADISKNKMSFSWFYDKNGNLKKFSQDVKSKKDYNVSAVYDGKNTNLTSKDSTGRISQTFAGLKIIKVSTNKGDLQWSY